MPAWESLLCNGCFQTFTRTRSAEACPRCGAAQGLRLLARDD